ncbi:calcium-binding protein CML22 [Spatholobus suberectus]|nr:calcium-binding protein CML22 [Spatholobus suberectus]
MGATLCCIGMSSKKMCLDEKLERKIAEMRRYKFGKSKLKSVDSIVMLFPMFKERLKTLRGMFEQYDEDSNGSIEPSELKKFLEHLELHLTEQEIENLFQYCDLDGSKGIQFNEFIVLLCLIHLLAEPSSSDNSSKAELAQVGEVFNTIVEVFVFFDQNGDGKLNQKDMVRTLNETNPRERSPARISKRRFQEMDWDKNGQVTFREFLFGFINWVGIDADE